jgi:CPA2 family monovalent cation:H+ antiporter-2
MILTLVLLPALAGLLNGSAGVGAAALAVPVLVTLGKVAAFVAVMLVIGKRLIPAILHWVAHSGSRELFRLSVLAIALGVAFGATQVFDVSFALGAFFAGMILSESELSHRAAQETLPLRDAFAVLFFVSVGMLVDPGIVVRDAGALLAVVLIVVIGKSVAAFAIVRLFGYPTSHALTVSASLAQIGEFSFILAGLGVSLALLPERGRDLILAGAIISILLNPVLFALLDWTLARARARARKQAADAEDAEKQSAPEGIGATQLSGHVVLVGHGRVGRVVSARLKELQIPLLLIEENRPLAAEAREAGLQVIHGNATSRDVLADCNLAAARCLLVAIPDAFEGGQIVSQARAVSGSLHIVARSHSDEETEHLEKFGASSVVMGEREIAMAMLADIGDSGGPGPGASTT